jgi:hypothetical protein
MRALAYLKKTFFENLREWKVLSLALVFAPAFVYMMYGYYCAATPAYRLLVVNHDMRDADGVAGAESTALLDAWRQAKHPTASRSSRSSRRPTWRRRARS